MGQVAPKTSSHDSNDHPNRSHHLCVHYLQPFWANNTTQQDALDLYYNTIYAYTSSNLSQD